VINKEHDLKTTYVNTKNTGGSSERIHILDKSIRNVKSRV